MRFQDETRMPSYRVAFGRREMEAAGLNSNHESNGTPETRRNVGHRVFETETSFG